jgi:TfoX/Sxy family transcriptional regulator of competence genes
MPMKMPSASQSATQAFNRLLPSVPGVTSRKMFGQPAAFVDGKMFFGVFGEDVFVRLSEADRNAAEKLPGAKAFEPMPGRAMTGYVVLPPAVVGDPRAAGVWVSKALRHARSLPDKKHKARKR